MKIPVNSLYLLLSIVFGLLVNTKLTAAQSIQTDGTTPTKAASCSDNCTIEGGLRQGNNLFHSFERFNVDAGTTVLFQDPGVTNILNRVTGNDLSEILGTLGVSGGDANLFLMNPNGIIFGQDASLDLNGSFLATTADGIRFGEQGLLDTTANQIPLLTINPSALSFADKNQGVIRNESTAPAGVNFYGVETFGLQISDGKSLLLVGGDVVFDRGQVNNSEARASRLELGGLAEAGEVELNFSDIDEGNISLNFPEQLQKANVLITNGSYIEILFAQKADIAINARNITLAETSFLGVTIFENVEDVEIYSNRAGNITLNATEKLELTDSSIISNLVGQLAQGDAGNININTDSLFISDGSGITASTFGQGDSGNINILSDSVNITGFGTTGFSSNLSTQTTTGALGQAGDITVNTNSFVIADGGVVTSQTSNESDGGNISINANNFEAVNGGQIVTSASDSGNAGNINLQIADNLLLSGSEPSFAERLTEFGKIVTNEFPGNSGLFANVRSEASGTGGNIEVTTDKLSIQDNAEINVSAESTGEAGSLNIDAQDVTLNQGSLTAETKVGDQGNITLNNADTLLLRNNSQITTNAMESATGGDINLTAEGIAVLDDSAITAQAVLGQGGNIKIDKQGIIFRDPNSQISANSQQGIDGTITIDYIDTNPALEVFQLTDIPIDAQAILDQNLCKFEDNKIAGGSSFIITGRGGFISTSTDLNDRDIVNWAEREDLQINDNGTVGVLQREIKDTNVQSYSQTQQAQGLVVAPDGSKWLTANVSNTTPQNSPNEHPDCSYKKR
ncbi:MAG: filamentous hemagglutinin N-terminal domain-containing protein [Waterburya sp.]